MANEIERKFLVRGTPWKDIPGIEITQGYLSHEGIQNTRVLIEDRKAFVTVNSEFTYDIPMFDAEQMLEIFEQDANRVVRLRIKGDDAYLTIKGSNQGMVRPEFEYLIPLSDTRAMLKTCEGPMVSKIRHNYEFEGFIWEIDVFQGENEGLVVAEIELESEDQSFSCPNWVGAEVTNDARYYNSNLVKHPFSKWTHTVS